ncbi:hypothetical protein OHB02_16850 [Streptomyces albidoflavus]|nr:hypothetical protein OHB02_16850 [Streptomyces albidoflavus]
MNTPAPPDEPPDGPDESAEPAHDSPQLRRLRARIAEENRLRRWLRRAL